MHIFPTLHLLFSFWRLKVQFTCAGHLGCWPEIPPMVVAGRLGKGWSLALPGKGGWGSHRSVCSFTLISISALLLTSSLYWVLCSWFQSNSSPPVNKLLVLEMREGGNGMERGMDRGMCSSLLCGVGEGTSGAKYRIPTDPDFQPLVFRDAHCLHGLTFPGTSPCLYSSLQALLNQLPLFCFLTTKNWPTSPVCFCILPDCWVVFYPSLVSYKLTLTKQR